MTLVAEPHPVATDHTTHHATDDAAGLTADPPAARTPLARPLRLPPRPSTPGSTHTYAWSMARRGCCTPSRPDALTRPPT